MKIARRFDLSIPRYAMLHIVYRFNRSLKQEQ